MRRNEKRPDSQSYVYRKAIYETGLEGCSDVERGRGALIMGITDSLNVLALPTPSLAAACRCPQQFVPPSKPYRILPAAGTDCCVAALTHAAASAASRCSTVSDQIAMTDERMEPTADPTADS